MCVVRLRLGTAPNLTRILTMKKSVLLLMAASLLVSCGKSPKDIINAADDSTERIVNILAGDDSLRDKDEAVKEEIERMKDLRQDARSLSSTPEKYSRAIAEVRCKRPEEFDARETAYRFYSSKINDEELSKSLKEYDSVLEEVWHELYKSCHMDD